MALAQAVHLGADPVTRFAVLVHDLGKGSTPALEWPRHLGHEQRGAELVRVLSQRLRVPNMYRELGVLTARYHTHAHRALGLRPENPAQAAAGAGRAAQGRSALHSSCWPAKRTPVAAWGWKNVPIRRRSCCGRYSTPPSGSVTARTLVAQGLSGLALAEALFQARLAAITAARRAFAPAGA